MRRMRRKMASPVLQPMGEAAKSRSTFATLRIRVHSWFPNCGNQVHSSRNPRGTAFRRGLCLSIRITCHAIPPRPSSRSLCPSTVSVCGARRWLRKRNPEPATGSRARRPTGTRWVSRSRPRTVRKSAEQENADAQSMLGARYILSRQLNRSSLLPVVLQRNTRANASLFGCRVNNSRRRAAKRLPSSEMAHIGLLSKERKCNSWAGVAKTLRYSTAVG